MRRSGVRRQGGNAAARHAGPRPAAAGRSLRAAPRSAAPLRAGPGRPRGRAGAGRCPALPPPGHARPRLRRTRPAVRAAPGTERQSPLLQKAGARRSNAWRAPPARRGDVSFSPPLPASPRRSPEACRRGGTRRRAPALRSCFRHAAPPCGSPAGPMRRDGGRRCASEELRASLPSPAPLRRRAGKGHEAVPLPRSRRCAGPRCLSRPVRPAGGAASTGIGARRRRRRRPPPPRPAARQPLLLLPLLLLLLVRPRRSVRRPLPRGFARSGPREAVSGCWGAATGRPWAAASPEGRPRELGEPGGEESPRALRASWAVCPAKAVGHRSRNQLVLCGVGNSALITVPAATLRPLAGCAQAEKWRAGAPGWSSTGEHHDVCGQEVSTSASPALPPLLHHRSPRCIMGASRVPSADKGEVGVPVLHGDP